MALKVMALEVIWFQNLKTERNIKYSCVKEQRKQQAKTDKNVFVLRRGSL
jgi:hypothetical protein